MKSSAHPRSSAVRASYSIKSIKSSSKVLATLFTLMITPAMVKAQEQSMPPAQVKVVALEKRQLAPVSEATGSVISDKNSKISTEIQAAVQWLAPVGKAVAEQEVIAKLDPRLYAIAEKQAEAQVKRLKAELAFQQQELERLKSLIARDNAAKSLYQKEQATFRMLQQDLKSAELQLSKASGDLALTEVKAPFAGVIVSRLAQVGEYLGVGMPLLQLVDHSNKVVTIAAPVKLLSYLADGLEIEVAVYGETKKLPLLTRVPVADPVSRMMELRLDASHTDWLVGSPATAMLPKAKPELSIAVDRDTLVMKNGQWMLYRVTKENTAEQITADIKSWSGRWAILNNQLKEGDKVIIRGAERLQPGQAVAPEAF